MTATAQHDPAGPVAVVGLWHLGAVTAACLAEAGFDVVGLDQDAEVVAELSQGRPPIAEPGLAELTKQQIAGSRLRFTTDRDALRVARLAWITFDTPVDDEDRADVESVLSRSVSLLGSLPEDSLVVVSSQLPVGSAQQLRDRCIATHGNGGPRVACVPENLRLGQALDAFRRPDRFVAGVRSERDREELAGMLAPFTDRVEWMGVESAEMTKHALNGFLATSVAFINEVASLCEPLGADAADVSRGLKTERRIGPGAYLSPGDAFAGGTLARDVTFLRSLAERHGRPANVLGGVLEGNAAHRGWTRRKLLELLGDDQRRGEELRGRTVAVWGLTYKPGTDTLRRSTAVELCIWLLRSGAAVRVHDPAVAQLPAELERCELCATAADAAASANALALCTPWPEYREIAPELLRSNLTPPATIVDPAGFLASTLDGLEGFRYVRVGSAGAPLAMARDAGSGIGGAGPERAAESHR